MLFQLRPWRDTDADSLARYANHEGIARNLRDVFPHPYTLDDARAYIRLCREADPSREHCCAIEVAGEAAGSIGLFRQADVNRQCAELGYWLGEPFWGKGVMTEAVRQICSDGFRRWDIVRIYAEPFARNTGSCRVLEKAGFVREGILRNSVFKNGVVEDACLYALLKGEKLYK